MTPDDNELAEKIRTGGLRATGPRVQVLRVLHSGDGHRTAPEVVDALARRGIDVARMSVYNVLNNLTRVGVVSAVDLGSAGTVYELGHGGHHHFVCRRCGRVLDVSLAGEEPRLAAEVSSVEVDEVTVVFHGRCADCAGKD